MKCVISKIEQPFTDKFKDNYVVHFDYFGNEQKAIITKNMLNFNKREFINVGDSIEVLKGFKNNNVQYRVIKVY